LVSIAFIIFVLGLLYQGRQFFKLTRKKEWILPPPTGDTLRQGDPAMMPHRVPVVEKRVSKTMVQYIIAGLASLKGTFWKTDPLMMIVTSLFHVCLILVPIFLLGHNILLDQSWGGSDLRCVFPDATPFSGSGSSHHFVLRLFCPAHSSRPLPHRVSGLSSVV
jgi:hypothetical protein